jgi:hypothetical protein
MKVIPCLQLVAALGVAVVLSNCAGTTPQAAFTQQMVDTARIAREDSVSIKVTSTDPNMLPTDRQRLGEKVTHKVKSIAQSRGGAARKYEVSISISRYDKGNAFARAMLAGLGQIHINGVVAVYQQPGKSKVGEFKLDKTFAWGGIYGGSVSMDTIEDAYAQAVAESVSKTK